MQMGSMHCPEQVSKSLGLVVFERPWLVTLGFTLITLGFIIQFLAIADPKTVDQLRAELKAHRRLQQAKEKNQSSGK
jgi:uncharacterized membrane protein